MDKIFKTLLHFFRMGTLNPISSEGNFNGIREDPRVPVSRYILGADIGSCVKQSKLMSSMNPKEEEERLNQ